MKKEDIIERLNLIPLVGEGGFVNEIYRSNEYFKGRKSCGTIYYMLTNSCCSIMHRLDADEIWYYHDGPALNMLLIYPDHSEVRRLGMDVLNGEVPQIVVEAGVWQGSLMAEEGEYTLVSTSMTPAYDPNGFEAGTYEMLEPLLTDETHKALLKRLTEEPKYE